MEPKKFIESLVKKCGCNVKGKFLLAVSGGVDSVVLAHLFHDLGFNFGIAHCNFMLRSDDSQKDAEFVKEIAKKLGAPFFLKSFATRKFATQKKISIEMAARKLRYEWFEKIRKSKNYDYIVTAHHADDMAETVLINLVRGTGINGLTGIPVRNKYIVRPLLAFSKQEIIDFAVKRNLHFCEDKTNADTVIFRNKIRHKILPVLKDLNPSFLQTMLSNTSHFSQIRDIYETAIENFKKNFLRKEGDVFKLKISDLEYQKSLPTYLFKILKKFNFGSKDILPVIDSFNAIPGKIFYSSTHILVRDRDFLLISPRTQPEMTQFYVEKQKAGHKKPFHFQIDFIVKIADFQVDADRNKAFLDAEKLIFPLLLRKWKQGDSFIPLGMKGTKKISDFFTDHKVSMPEKDQKWLLLSNNKIVWVVGMRIDDRFKVTTATKQICKLTLDPLRKVKNSQNLY